MDLVAGVRKEGSRGGRADFKWSDVTTSTHRENYLGHSLMAPVGRWQKNKDLSWYAKGDKTSEEEAAEARREEIRKVKEAEQAAMGEALGFGPAAAAVAGENANETPLGEGKGRMEEAGLGGTPEERALRRIVEEERGKARRRSGSRDRDRDRDQGRERRYRRREDHDDEGGGRARRRHHHRHHHRDREHSRDRSRSRSGDEERHRHRYRDERYRERSYDRRRSRSRERRRSYSRDRERDYERRR